MQVAAQVHATTTQSHPSAGVSARRFHCPPRDPARSRTAIRLSDVARDELGHLEHAHLALAVKNRPERIVGVDLSSLRFVLKTVLFDVVPKPLGELGTWDWF